jgi:hypothetical protein
MRATRRLDQLRQTQKETVGLAKPGPKEFGLTENPNYAPTLASQGIDKNLAHQARTLGALSEERLEQVVTGPINLTGLYRRVMSHYCANGEPNRCLRTSKGHRTSRWMEACREDRNCCRALSQRSCGMRVERRENNKRSRPRSVAALS